MQINNQIINLAQKRLEAASEAFLKEIDDFIVRQSQRNVQVIKNDPNLPSQSYIENLTAYFNDWGKADLQQRQDLQQNINKTLSDLNDNIIDLQGKDNPVTELQQFLDAMQTWSLQIHQTLASSQTDDTPDVSSLAKKAEQLREFTQHWTIYHNTWEQRWSNLNQQPPERPQAITTGDDIVRHFYEVVDNKGLALKIPNQLLLTAVPFMDRLYAEGFDLPMPYIVAPRWAYQQKWAWIGYAHEVGHHIYRNVVGLSEELKVNLAFTLARSGEDYATQRIWFNWLEEIFADLFGLLQVGPNFLEVQQTLLPLYLPPHILKTIGKETDSREGLLRAADDTHPVPYLRMIMGVKALRLLRSQIPQDAQDQWDKIVEQLEKRWKDFFDGVDLRVVNYLVFPTLKQLDRKSVIREVEEVEIPLVKMKNTLSVVLDVILFTNLNALKGATMADAFTQLSLNEFIEKIKAKQPAVANAQVRRLIAPETSEANLMLVNVLDEAADETAVAT